MQITPGRFVYEQGQRWLRDNDPDTPLVSWNQIRAKEQQYWEMMGRAVQTAIVEQRWDGFFCGLTFGFLSAAVVFIVARS